MKKDKIEKYYILGLVIFIILSILIIQSLIVFSTEQLKKPVGKKETTTTVSEPKVVETITETVGSCAGSGSEVGMGEMTTGGNRFDATAGGREGTYCNQNGKQLYHESKTGAPTTNLASLEAIIAGGTIYGNESYVKGQAALNPYSLPQLYCKMHDVELSEVAPDVAFAVASGASSDEIQQAVWGKGTGREVETPQGPLPLGNDNPIDVSQLTPGEVELIEQSGDYSDFKDLKDSYQMPDQNMSLDIKVNTDEALVQVDYDKQILIVGPIYIDYPSGGAFGGISDMYFEGINSQGNTVSGQERIEINNYGSSPDKIDQELKFFDPSREIIEGTTNNKTFMDTSNDKSYPASGQGFYVTINNPNQGISGSFSVSETITKKETLKISTVTKVKMHYSYQWMEVTSVKGCYLGAYVEHLFWTTPTKTGKYICGHHSWSCYNEDDELDCGHYHSASCYEWCASPYLTREEAQEHLVITKIIKTLYEQEVIVEIEIPIEIEIDVEISMNINIDVNVEGRRRKHHDDRRKSLGRHLTRKR